MGTVMSERLGLLIGGLISALVRQGESTKPSRAARHGNSAQIVSAGVALIALIGVALQLYYIGLNAKIATARQVYMSYSEASLRYPELAEPDLQKLKNSPTEFVQYKGFVSHMLFAHDEISSVYDKPEWSEF
jgi:hypothetical protein